MAAVSAAAALCAAGCSMSHPAPVPAPIAADPQAGTQKVHAIATDIEAALDNIDRDRLRKAETMARAMNSGSPGTAGDPAGTPGGGAVGPAAIAGAERTTRGAGSAAESAASADSASGGIARPTTLPAGSGAGDAALSKTDAATPGSSINAMLSPADAAARAKNAAGADAAGRGAATPTRSGGTAIISPLGPLSPSPTAAMGSMTAVSASAPPRNIDSEESAAPSPGPAAAPELSLEQALEVVRKNVSVHPTLATALALSLLEGPPKSDSADAAKGLSDADQKILGDMLSALETMKTASSGNTVSERAMPLLDAAKKWQADADLSLPRLVLASRVDSFGVFTAIDPKFEQGKRHTVIIYCEVANFATKKGEDGWYATHLSQQETLITEDGLMVWRPNAEQIEDRSLNQRHDFYMVKKLTIPENLPSGKYTLQMKVTDRTTGKIAIMNLPIEIVSR